MTRRYVSYDASEQASDYPSASTVTGDTVVQQSETAYDAAGNAVQSTVRERLDGDTGTGDLTTMAGGQLAARVANAATWYDPIGRPVAMADYGTNGDAALARPAAVPVRADAVLVSSTAYDAAGEAYQSTDPRGLVTQTTYDAAGRKLSVVEDVGGVARTTGYTYTPDGLVGTMTAANAGTGNQTTTYAYGSTTAESGVARSTLPQAVAEGRVGHPAPGRRRVRGGHGGRAGGVRAAARPVPPGRGRGREAGATDGPRPRPAPAPAGGRGQGGPRVRAGRDGQGCSSPSSRWRSWRRYTVTDRRARPDFAHFVRDLLEGRYRYATTVVLVMDNPNTRSTASLYAAFPPVEARRPADRLEVHHTPKHGSWLNVAEADLAALGKRLPDRLDDVATLARHAGPPRWPATLARHAGPPRWPGTRRPSRRTATPTARAVIGGSPRPTPASG